MPRRLLAGALAGTASVVLVGVTSAEPAGAVEAAANYGGQCGSGYRVLDSRRVADRGTVFLVHHAEAGKHCVVTIRNGPGARGVVRAVIHVDGALPIDDTVIGGSYAGPVRAPTEGHCFQWGGSIDGPPDNVSRTGA